MRGLWTLVIGTLALGGLLYFTTSSHLELEDNSSRKTEPAFHNEMIELTRAEFVSKEFTRWDASIPDSVGRIVVIPDVHGDMRNFIRSIWLGLNRVDQIPISPRQLEELFHQAVYHGRYPDKPISTDETTMVQLGDVVDRGPESLECLRVLWSIEGVVGWKVISLYGNHEPMSAIGNQKEYIHPRELSWMQFQGMGGRYKAFQVGQPLGDMIKARSMGMARVVSSAANKGILFVHAGITLSFFDKHIGSLDDIEEFNARFAEVLAKGRNGDEQSLIEFGFADDSILWTRVLAYAKDEVLCTNILPKILLRLNVDRIVVGHTPQPDHSMKSRCGGRVILTDIAMSRWMYDDEGQPGILVFRNGPGADWSDIEAWYLENGVTASFQLFPSGIASRLKIIEGGEGIEFKLIRGLFASIKSVHLSLEVEFTDGKRGVLDLEQGREAWDRYAQLQTSICAEGRRACIKDHGLLTLFGQEFSFAVLESGQLGPLALLDDVESEEPVPLSPKQKSTIMEIVEDIHSGYKTALAVSSVGELLSHFARDTQTDEIHLVSLKAVSVHEDKEAAIAYQTETQAILKQLVRPNWVVVDHHNSPLV